jgi:hypothetical protein
MDVSQILSPPIVTLISAIVGASIGMVSYRLGRRKTEFDTHTYVRQLLQDSFEFRRELGIEFAAIRADVTRKIPLPEAVNTSDFLELIELLNHKVDEKNQILDDLELRTLLSKTYSLYYFSVNRNNLFVYSIRDLLNQHLSLLNNYERYLCYHFLLMSERFGVDSEGTCYSEAVNLYECLLRNNDSANAARMGMSLC